MGRTFLVSTMQSHREIRENLSSSLQAIGLLQSELFPFEKGPRDGTRFDMQLLDATSIGFFQQVDVKRTPDALTLKILVRVEAINVSIVLELDETDDQSLSFGNVGLLVGQSFAPM
jgi:hypothetical protein